MRLLSLALIAAACLAGAAQAKPLVIVAEDYAPATFMADGKPAGIDVDVAKAVFDHLGVPYEIRLTPLARAWEMLKTGDADVGLHFSISDERAPFVHWPKNAVWIADFVFMTNDATKAAHNLESFDDVKKSGLTVGIINQNAYNPAFWEAFPSPDRANQHYFPQLAPASDAQTNLKKLEANHIQLFPFPLILGSHLVKDLHLTGVTHYDWVLFSKPYPNAFSDKSTYSDAKYPNIQALMQA